MKHEKKETKKREIKEIHNHIVIQSILLIVSDKSEIKGTRVKLEK